MRILVTGGAGYIGSVLTHTLLEAGYNVTVLDRLFFGTESLKDIQDQIRIIKNDIRYFPPTTLNNIDAILDLASLSNDPSGELNPKKTLDINYKGRVRVAKLAKKHKIKKYVLANTCSVYGFQEGLLTEESKLNPLTTYSKANVYAEKEILPLADKNFTATSLRQATVYGYSKRMRFDIAINGMVLGFYKNSKIPIMRDGKQWRPFVHVKDTSRAFQTIIESDPQLVNHQTFNVSSNEQNVQIYPLAQRVAEAINMPFNYEWYGSTDNRSYKVSFDKIAKTLKYKTKYTIKDGAQEVYQALKKGELNPDDPKTITVKWYSHLLETQKLIKNLEIKGTIL